MFENFPKDWKLLLNSEFMKDYFLELQNFIQQEFKTKLIYPKLENIFNAFELTSLKEIKVVVLGQDPYHGKGQAHGLSFSVPKGVKTPPSLKNIFKEYHNDLNYFIPENGDLTHWAKQGVLLLNATLSVEAGKAGSHQKKGWEQFTDEVISKISKEKEHIVFILWGSYAQKKKLLIDQRKHLILTAPHPSPLSAYRGFFGSKPFSTANKYLIKNRKKPIDWKLPSDSLF